MSEYQQRPRAATPLKHGKLTEVSALTPIIHGRVPGERRTYEQRLRFNLDRLNEKLKNGIPSELHLIHTLHFGKITIIRPEQYLSFTRTRPEENRPQTTSLRDEQMTIEEEYKIAKDLESDYKPIDDFGPASSIGVAGQTATNKAPNGKNRTWVLTQVVFDGDVKAYFRDVANRLNTFFDAIYENCVEYPGSHNFEKFWQWILCFQIGSDMFYAGNPNLSVTRIRELEDFKRRFDHFVSRVRSANGGRVENMDELFDDFLMETRQRSSGFPAHGGVYTGTFDESEESK